MIPCISQATTLSTPFLADLEAYARTGWSAFEIWLTKLELALEANPIESIRSAIDASGLTPLAAATQGGLLGSNPAERTTHRDHFLRRLDWLRALNVSTLVLVPDFTARPHEADLRHAVDSLCEAAQLASAANVRLALECQRAAPFCASLDTTLALVAQCDQPNLGICLDLFHYYTGPSKFEDLGYLTNHNLFHVHVSDLAGTPRELATDADRILPGDGDFQLAPIFDHLRSIEYAGGLSVEVNAPALWQIPADRVAEVARHALLRSLEPDRVVPRRTIGAP